MTHHARITYDEGDVYTGQWSSDGKRQGRGMLTLSSGVSYRGEFVNGHFQGSGTLSFPNGSLYEGSFEVSKYSGHGVHRNKEGMVYEGQFKEGKAKGHGLITYPDGSHGAPRCEGVFDGDVCVRRCDSSEAVRRAKLAQTTARSLSEQLQ